MVNVICTFHSLNSHAEYVRGIRVDIWIKLAIGLLSKRVVEGARSTLSALVYTDLNFFSPFSLPLLCLSRLLLTLTTLLFSE